MKKITMIEPVAAMNNHRKRRVAAYCRVSSSMTEQLVSLEVQKAHYEEYISSNPEWEFAGLYYDEGISGTHKETRPALLQLMADCEDHKIDYIVTKSLSRFARNVTDCLELVRKLTDLGIPIYFERENLDTGSMESELLLSIMSSLAESESVSISENMKWDARHRFQNGAFNNGAAPYGYDIVDGQYMINEAEARWVRYIFEQALAGKSCHRIAAVLNEKDVPAKKGGTWTGTTVHGILRNERYVGDCLYQKTYSDFRFRRHVNYGEEDQYYVEDHHEAIISLEDFESAGQMLLQRAKEKNTSRGKGLYRNRYPFTKKIVCGECGSFFKRQAQTATTVKYTTWSCREHRNNRKQCSMKAVREAALENAFATMMNKLSVFHEEVLGRLLDDLKSQGSKENYHRISEINDALEKISDRRQSLSALLAGGYIDNAAYTQEMNRMYVEVADLEAEKKRIRKEIHSDSEKVEELRDLLKWAEEGQMLTGFEPELFQRFVDKIVVSSRDEVEFHLRCGLKLKEKI